MSLLVIVTPNRKTVAEPFGAGDHIGRDTPVLDSEPLAAGAAPTGLHFIADEEAAVPAHDIGDDLEIFLRRRDEAADSLNRFHDDAGDAPGSGGANQLFEIVRAADAAIGIRETERAAIAVGVMGVDNAGLDLRTGLPGGIAGDGHRERRAAVIRMTQRNDLA
jgi:hypothetical protein